MPGIPARGARRLAPRPYAQIALICIIIGTLALVTAQRARAAIHPRQEADEPPLILLGEYYFQQVAAGRTAQLQIRLPLDGVYLLTSDDLASAAFFTLTLFDESGRELYSDRFQPVELELEAARYMLQFQMQEPAADNEPGSDPDSGSDGEADGDSDSGMDAAVNPAEEAGTESVPEALLSFVMLGNLGEMSAEESAPGQLYSGGFYRASDVDGPRHGVLTVPASPYPQEVNLSVAPGEGGEYFVLAQGPDIDAVSIDTTETNLLRFWTQGGDYRLRVLPVGPASQFTLVPFLSGPPPLLPLGEAEEGVLPARTNRVIYQVVLDEFYGKLALTLESDATNIRMQITRADEDEPLFTTSFGAKELTLADLEAGTYYVTVESIASADANVEFVLRAEGVAGASIATLDSGTVTTSTLENDARAHLYEFPVTQAGALVTVTLTGDAAANIRLVVGAAASENIWRSREIGKADATTRTLETVFVAPAASTYLAEVRGDAGASFTLEVQEGPVAPALTLGQAMWGQVEPHRSTVYRLPIEEPGQLLTLLLVGADATDPALRVTAYDADGIAVYTSHTPHDATAAISRAAAPVGLYEVVVEGGETGGHYFLLPRLEAPVALATQWALDTVIEDPAASAVLGEPNAIINEDGAPSGDIAPTWSPPADGVISLVLTYAHPVTPSGVTIYTDTGVGAVVAVEAYQPSSKSWSLLWEESADELKTDERVRSLSFAGVDFLTNQIRLLIDTNIAIPAIDAVALVGLP